MVEPSYPRQTSQILTTVPIVHWEAEVDEKNSQWSYKRKSQLYIYSQLYIIKMFQTSNDNYNTNDGHFRGWKPPDRFPPYRAPSTYPMMYYTFNLLQGCVSKHHRKGVYRGFRPAKRLSLVFLLSLEHPLWYTASFIVKWGGQLRALLCVWLYMCSHTLRSIWHKTNVYIHNLYA